MPVWAGERCDHDASGLGSLSELKKLSRRLMPCSVQAFRQQCSCQIDLEMSRPMLLLKGSWDGVRHAFIWWLWNNARGGFCTM